MKLNVYEQLGKQSITILLLYFVFIFMMFKNQYALQMIILILIQYIINFGTKKQIKDWMAPYKHRFPLLGSFCRPIDKNCKMNTSNYGMPSGHAQITSFIASFYYFTNPETATSSPLFYFYSGLALFVMATRYTSKMHTITQLIIGSLYGIFWGFLFSYFFSRKESIASLDKVSAL